MKYKSDGSIERYKVRLVAKGYTQTYGIYYLETFALLAKMNIVRALLSLAANFRWNLQHFDVKNVFLHGDLEEEIYIEVPPRFESKEGMVCKLKKALYGLKQSPRAWFGRLTKVLIALGYKQNQGDHSLLVKHFDLGGVTALLEAYTDADNARSMDDGRSTSGYCTLLGGNLVTWRSKKQNLVARSSAKSEFRSMAKGICELFWLKIILDDLKIKWESK